MGDRKQPTEPPTNQVKPPPPPAPPRPRLALADEPQPVHTDVRDRYQYDAVFHYQVEAIAHEAVMNSWQGDQGDRQHAVRLAKEAIILWLERFGR